MIEISSVFKSFTYDFEDNHPDKYWRFHDLSIRFNVIRHSTLFNISRLITQSVGSDFVEERVYWNH